MNRFRYNIDPTERAHRQKSGCWRCGSQEHEYCSTRDNGDGLFVIGKPHYFFGRTELGVIPLDEWNAGRRDFPVLSR